MENKDESKKGYVEKLLCPGLRHDELLTDGPNNFNQQIETEETTEVRKTLGMGGASGAPGAVETITTTVSMKRYLYVHGHETIFELFMPHILFTFSAIFFLQSICAAVVIFS